MYCSTGIYYVLFKRIAYKHLSIVYYLLSFTINTNLFYFFSLETPIGKLPKLNDIIGAKSITDGLFYRAQVVKKINDVSYNVQFIDYGIEENVHLSDIVSLSTELKKVSYFI